MSITENMRYYVQDIQQEIFYSLDKISERDKDLDVGPLSCLKKYAIEFLDITHRVIKKNIAHFPKTVLIALSISSISAVIFFSLSNLFVLGLNFYFFLKCNDRIFKAIKKYDGANVSEWTSPTEEKRKIVLAMEDGVTIRNFFQNVSGFFRRIFLSQVEN
ncbi:MAG: hypothetical protein WCP39_07360 [Chlamydiota bacterium]